MYENLTYEDILNRMLNRIPNSYDKREGSVIFDALAPAAVELKQMYMELDNIMNECFADTASRDYLIKRAAERGLTPYEATKAIIVGKFEPFYLEIPMGSRFSCENMTYAVISKLSDGEYLLECETAGIDGNIGSGTLLMIDNISGLTSAEITSISSYGENEEDTEIFRSRYFQSLQTDAFGGNRIDYVTKTKSLAGVGGVKVYGAKEWNGGGTVKLVVQSSVYGVPTQTLIDRVQENIDPVETSGEGYGIAPIGHFVTVVPVDETTINMTFDISFAENYNWSLVQADVENAIDTYFSELNTDWENQKNITVRIAQIESRILAVEGVLDIGNTVLNGRAENIQVDKDSIVVRGTING